MKEQADLFLEYFRKIENALEKLENTTDPTARSEFVPLVMSLNKKNILVSRYAYDLLRFAKLRNAIVHTYAGKDVYIAYPLPESISRIKTIADALTSPPSVQRKFGKKVVTVDFGASLTELLNKFRSYDISQIPIINGTKIVEVINGNSITRWLSNHEILEPGDVKVQELIPDIERKNNFRFCKPNTSVFDAADIFRTQMDTGWYLDCILITPSGKNGEELQGIIVLEDIAPFLTNGGGN